MSSREVRSSHERLDHILRMAPMDHAVYSVWSVSHVHLRGRMVRTLSLVVGLLFMILPAIYIWSIAVLTINPYFKDVFICSAIAFCMGIGLVIAGFVGG